MNYLKKMTPKPIFKMALTANNLAFDTVRQSDLNNETVKVLTLRDNQIWMLEQNLCRFWHYCDTWSDLNAGSIQNFYWVVQTLEGDCSPDEQQGRVKMSQGEVRRTWQEGSPSSWHWEALVSCWQEVEVERQTRVKRLAALEGAKMREGFPFCLEIERIRKFDKTYKFFRQKMPS